MPLLTVKPTYFDVKYAINPHMRDHSGCLNSVDIALAHKQWQSISQIYQKLGLEVFELEPLENCPDMVFCANTFLSFIKNKKRYAVLSNMHSVMRRPETIATEKWLRDQNFEIITLPSHIDFEGTGDGIWDFTSNELYLGYGHRTNLEAVAIISNYIPQVRPLKLIDERFYHLDTCFAVLNKDTAVYIEEAFDHEGISLLKAHFKELIRIDLDEGIDYFAANLFCPNEKDIIMQKGASKLKQRLEKLGFVIHEVQTSEFIKSGGSVFCMKNHFL